MDTETTGIGLLIGFVLPWLIAIVEQSHWTDGLKSIVAIVVCLIAAFVSSIFVDGVDLSEPGFDWVTWFGTIWGAAVVSFRFVWKPTNVVPRIEENTNITHGPPANAA